MVIGRRLRVRRTKGKLNKLFPYAKPKCLTEEEFTYLTESKVLDKNVLIPSEQRELLKIYNRVFSQKRQPTSCGSCLREVVNGLNKVVNEYKEDNESSEG